MKEQFATYEISLALKGLGFNEKCFGFYLPDKELLSPVFHQNSYNYRVGAVSNVDAPLWQQAIDWLDSKKGLFIHINKSYTCYNYQVYKYSKYDDCNELIIDESLIDLDYDIARKQAILEALKTLEGCTNSSISL